MTRPSTEWKEIVQPREAEELEELAEQLRALQRQRARGRPARRSLHGKSNAGLEAELEIVPDLPAHARVGLFAAPGRYRAYVRYSNGAAAGQPDARPDVRGVAIKVLGVAGPKIAAGLEAATTQDFLLIQNPSTPFRDAHEFVWFVRAVRSPALLVPRALLHFGPVRAVQILRRAVESVRRPITSVARSRYFSAVPVRFGSYAAKYALRPREVADRTLARDTTDFLGADLAARLADGPVGYDFQVQFYVDEARTPIEDASVEWKESDAPFLTVARLMIPRQDPTSPRGRRIAERVETFSFDPWHTTADFRPLGHMMRARNAAYRLARIERGAAGEPEDSEV